MTKRAIFTQADIRRAIKAAQSVGLRIAGVRPDGIVIVHDGDNPLVPVAGPGPAIQATDAARWGDGEA
jgi:hypothetical protein